MSKYSGAETLASFAFVLFVLSWTILRIICYPFWILRSTRFALNQFPVYTLFSFCHLLKFLSFSFCNSVAANLGELYNVCTHLLVVKKNSQPYFKRMVISLSVALRFKSLGWFTHFISYIIKKNLYYLIYIQCYIISSLHLIFLTFFLTVWLYVFWCLFTN